MITTAVHTETPVETPTGNHLFPVFLKLEQMQVVLLGAGPVGLEKLQALLRNAPATRIKVISENMLPEVKTLAENYPNVQLIQKSYEATDLDGAQLVISALNNKPLSAEIKQQANANGILVNVADTPDLCDFYLSSVVKKGNLKIAISTNGMSPTVAKRLRETLEDTLPDSLEDVLENMQVIRNRMKGDFHQKVKKLNKITAVLARNENADKAMMWRKVATRSLIVFASMLIGHFIFSYIPFRQIGTDILEITGGFDPNFKWMLMAGFLAQLVDGALGMGYGLVSVSVLLSTGISPAAISGSIHTAEMFASGASGYSHYRFGNVNKRMFKALVIPGVLGAIGGAILLWSLDKGGETGSGIIRVVLAAYMLLLGIRMIANAFKNQLAKKRFRRYSLLAGAGGFLDSFGGGGWGPLVTSTLISKGRTPRFVIGTVSLTEFFVTLASAFTFFILLGVSHWQTILGLVIGGVVAAPVAAKLAGRLPRKTAFLLIGILVIIWSVRLILKFAGN